MLVAVLLVVWLAWPQGAWGAIAQPDRVPLTLELLQSRLKTPVPIEGVATIDLRRLIIDLRPENATLRDAFYPLVRDRLLRSSIPLGLDFSFSQILGEFDMREIGLRVPLYGESLPANFTAAEQTQLLRDRRRIAQLSQLSRSLVMQAQLPTLQISVLRGPLRLNQTRFENSTNFNNTFFLNALTAQGADFAQAVDWSEARFGSTVSFAGALFRHTARFRSTIFFKRTSFNQARFRDTVTFQSSEFQDTANFSKALFEQPANLTRVVWLGNADFAQTEWQSLADFDRSKFGKSLFLAEATFHQNVTFREAQFIQPINLRGATLQQEADFGDVIFGANAYLNVVGLQFNPDDARIMGSPGEIGRHISVPTLQGNETLLRNIVRNFRLQEQIADANQTEYLMQKLRLSQLWQRLTGLNINTASPAQLRRVGLSDQQIAAIATLRQEQPFRNTNDLLKLDDIDLSTYVKVRDRLVAAQPRALLDQMLSALNGLELLILLLLTAFGTNTNLVFGLGMVAIAFYALLFWLLDRLRRQTPQPIAPTAQETTWMLATNGLLMLLGLSAIFRSGEFPWLSLLCGIIIFVPFPLVLTIIIYRQGRYHDQMDTSYLVEDGSTRQLRILIGRLPNIPRYPFFRERFSPLLWDRRWNWLNYIDFSLNNMLRFGFNDVRLRDEALPGLINAIVWYQWTLGLLYVSLFLWTLSRTIPGLNLLIYFK
ncbi:pentapeptide repeat-containing protein [Leptolyngbya sp. AN02str]